jgi:hypothetical protein
VKNTLSSKAALQPPWRNKDLQRQRQAKVVYVYHASLHRILKEVIHIEKNEKNIASMRI